VAGKKGLPLPLAPLTPSQAFLAFRGYLFYSLKSPADNQRAPIKVKAIRTKGPIKKWSQLKAKKRPLIYDLKGGRAVLLSVGAVLATEPIINNDTMVRCFGSLPASAPIKTASIAAIDSYGISVGCSGSYG
jgi:hypothetical protein